MTPFTTNGILLSMLSLFTLVSCDSRNHQQYSFKDLREAVDGDSLSSEDQRRLFDNLKLLNCTENKPTPDYRQVRKKIINKDVFHLLTNKATILNSLVVFGYFHFAVSSRRES